MAYKGTDLNLRSSQAWPSREAAGVEDSGANGGWLQASRGAPDPIPVDDNVLACCNSAYDAAQFHGAGEVRLEHLLHAMTRVKAAADLLEQLGIRTAQLRHETAVVIASEIPAVAEARSAPRTAGEVQDVLRHAASMAAERKVPASVADLLRALLSLGRKAPATASLMRAAVDASVIERWRDEPRRDGAAHAEAALRPNLADALFKRFDGMEAVLRAMQEEVATERKAMADVLPAISTEHMQSVASALEDKLAETVASLDSRLQAIDKLTSSEGWAFMGARIEVIEKQLARQSKEVADAVSNVLLEHMIKSEGEHGAQGTGGVHLAAIESSIETHLQRADEASKTHEHSLAEIYEALVKLGTNQQTLASNLNTWRVESSGDVSIISNRLEQMERNAGETLGRLDGQVQSLSQAVGRGTGRRVGGFKRWLYGTTSVLSGGWRDDSDVMRQRARQAGVPEESVASIVVKAADDATHVEEKKA